MVFYAYITSTTSTKYITSGYTYYTLKTTELGTGGYGYLTNPARGYVEILSDIIITSMSNMSKDIDNNGSQSMDNTNEKASLIFPGNSEKKSIRFRGPNKSVKPPGNRVENINFDENKPELSAEESSAKKCGIVFYLIFYFVQFHIGQINTFTS